MIVCMQCGSQNEKNANFCWSCNAVLPKLDTTAMITVDKVVGRFNQFKDAVERVKNGTWTSEEFFEFLQNIYATLAEKRLGTEGFIQEAGYEEYSGDEVRQGRDGMDHYELGMQEMSLFIEDGDVSHLDHGLDLIWQGNERINDAMRINRMERRKLEDEWGWM